jgi:hypothetical protein
MNNKINHLAVWILVIFDQVLGATWYSASLFGEPWLRYSGKTMAEMNASHGMEPYLIAIVAAIVLNYALAWLFARLNISNAAAGLWIAVLCWLAFLFVDYATIAAFSMKPWQLVFIDMGRAFVAFGVAGLLLGAWRKSE